MLHTPQKYTLLFSFLLLPPFITHTEEPDKIKKGEAITIPIPPGTPPGSVIISPIVPVNLTPTCTAEYKPTFITTNTTTIHAIGIKIEELTILIKQTINNTFTWNNCDLAKNYLRKLLWNLRYKIAGGTALSAYSGASLLLLIDYHHIEHNLFWGRWKKDSTFEDLCATSQKNLAKELLLAIGEHHYNENHPTDLAYPLITFIKTIDSEIDLLKRYLTSTKVIKKLQLLPIFPANEAKIEKSRKMLERTLFIKHIFLSWLAEYNLTSSDRMNG